MKIRTCIDCDATFEQLRGRPALRCPTCKPRPVKKTEPKTFTVEVTCSRCKGIMVERNATRSPGFLVAVIECTQCSAEMVVRFTAVQTKQPEGLRPCGTGAGAMRHHRAGEPPCEPCRLARNREAEESRARRASMASAT